MGTMIGESTGAYSTWGKLRCPIIGAYDQWQKTSGAGVQPHNLNIESGFHPNDGFFLRCDSWPYTFDWTVAGGGTTYTEYGGPIVGFQNGGGVSPYDSYFSVGAYQWNVNDYGFTYTSAQNLIDLGDITGSLVGLTVTYSGGTFTTTGDAFENDPPYIPWFGQSIGYNVITSVSGISTFTPF